MRIAKIVEVKLVRRELLGDLKAKLMENLSLQDLPQAGGPDHVQPAPGGPTQLPPQVRGALQSDRFVPR